jgi:multidrug efflux system outer membrane protein
LTSADPEIQRSDTAANFGNLSWREVFTDPYLRVLIDSALVRNTDLRTAHLRVKEAEATLLSARLSYLPAFSRQAASMAEKLLRPIHCPSVPVGRSISLAD